MKKLVLIALALISSLMANAQSSSRDSLPAFAKAIQDASKWLSDKNFQIRKTFDGSKEESKPMAISWNSDYENRKFYSVIDIGIKLSELPVFKKNNDFNLLFYPKLEWHRNTIDDDTKKKNNFTGGINTELLLKLGESWIAHPFIIGSFDYKNDRVKKIETTQAKAYLSFSGSKAGEPGYSIKDKTNALKFRYYPYVGIEQYTNLASPHKSAGMWAGRIFFEAYPVSRYMYNYVQLTFEYTHRWIISDNLYQKGNMRWLTAGLNFFPDGKGTLGIGLDYSYGEDPSSNFVDTKLLALGLKLKI